MAADSPNRWNLLRMLSRCAFRQAQAANAVSGNTPILQEKQKCEGVKRDA